MKVAATPVVVPAPTCTLTPSASTVTSGGASTLTWTATNAATKVINQGIGAVTGTSYVVRPTATTTYTMTVTNSAGVSRTCAATVKVAPVNTPIPRCDNFDATPVTINRGQSTVLSWNTTNANNVVINNGVGAVNVDGSTTVSPLENTNYVMTLVGANGRTETCSRAVTVVQPSVFTCSNNVNFYASRTTIEEGESTSLIWSTNGVTSLSISTIGDNSLSGNVSVNPNSDITYTLTATNGSQTISCPVTVNVNERSSGGSGGGSSSPKCTLKISDTKISRGDRVTLTWDTSRAYDVELKDNFGKIIVTTDGKSSSDKSDILDGEIVLKPEADTTYTLLAERGSKDRTCKVSVDVEDGITVLETRDQKPVVNGIALTQVPYTGFEAGPVLTMVFYTLLVLWALYLAYVLVSRKTMLAGHGVAHMPVMPTTPAHTEVTPVVASTMSTPRFVAPAAAVAADKVVGYASTTTRDTAYDAIATKVEDAAHSERVLLSSEAMRHFVEVTNEANRDNVLAAVIAKAKASYPAEDGWVVLNIDRMQSVCAACGSTPAHVPVFTPASVNAGNGSLAEAIVTGNIVAAYQLVGHRPMVSLAEAAAELDALYRAKQGGEVMLSGLMQTEGANLQIEQVKGAISALTSALDGTYTDEAEAVKMAILKAIKALA